MQVADFLSIDAFINAGAIALASGIGIQGLKGLRMTDERRTIWRGLWGLATLGLISLILWRGGQQSAYNRIIEKQNSDTHSLVMEMARNLSLHSDGSTTDLLHRIEKQIGPRTIGPNDAAEIANYLHAAGRYQFQIDVLSGDRETISFSQQLYNVLTLAGWYPRGVGVSVIICLE